MNVKTSCVCNLLIFNTLLIDNFVCSLATDLILKVVKSELPGLKFNTYNITETIFYTLTDFYLMMKEGSILMPEQAVSNPGSGNGVGHHQNFGM